MTASPACLSRQVGDFFAPGRGRARLVACLTLPPLYPAGDEPQRHLLSLPRGRGPSQTPKFLSPGPPSPWLPALLKGKPFCRFYIKP